jgi:hypothetical protein
MVPRLSVFEGICPSEGVHSEQKTMTHRLSTQLGIWDNEEPTGKLELFKEASGLSIEFEQKSVDRIKLNGVKVGLPDESPGNLDDFPSPCPEFKY